MRGMLIYLICFVICSVVNSILKSHIQETLFIEELLDIHGIIIRLILALLLTRGVLRVLDRSNG